MFQINTRHTFKSKQETLPAQVMDWLSHDLSIIDPDKKIVDVNEIRIKFDYPIDKPVWLTFRHKSGFTRKDIYRAIFHGYRKIYYNDTSMDKYGVWGHSIADLVIEGVCRVPPNPNDCSQTPRFTLLIGS